MSRIVASGGDLRTAELVWDALVSEWVVEGLTPYPEDNLERVFGVAEEERDEDLVLRILEELEVSVPAQDFIDSFGAVDTPLRIAQFVAECKRRVP